MCHGHQEETVASVRNTGQHVPPCNERGYDSKTTACLDESRLGRGHPSGSGGVHVAGCQHQEGKPDGKEEGGKGKGGSEGEEPEDKGEDEPALSLMSVVPCRGKERGETYVEIKSYSGIESGSCTSVRSSDVETSRCKDNSQSDPTYARLA